MFGFEIFTSIYLKVLLTLIDIIKKKITHKPVTSSKRTDEYPHGPHLKSNGCATHATQPF
jgi:hypothetical protein